MPEETLDVPAFAVALGLKRSAVRKAIARGKLTATRVRVGHLEKFAIPIGEVERYRAEHRTKRKEG